MAAPIIAEQSRTIPVAPGDAFARTLAVSLPDIFRRWYGPIPPIKAIRDQHGDWTQAGETRTIALAGGGTMAETLTDVEPPGRFGYTITTITGPMALLIDRVEGAWLFAPAGTGTRVSWRWTMHPRSALSAPAVRLFAVAWRGYAARGLAALADYLAG